MDTLSLCGDDVCADPAIAGARILCAWLAGWPLALLLERTLLRPVSSGGHGIPARHWLHLLLFTLLFILALALVWRPWFAAGITLALLLLVITVSNAKYQALREPFVFTDFGLFSQALKYPRLYLPFLDPWSALAGGTVIIGVIYLGLTLEPPLTNPLNWHWFLILLGVSALLILLALGVVGARAPRPSFDVVDDLGRFGLLPSLWLYWRAERGPLQDPSSRPTLATMALRRPGSPGRPDGDQPHLIVVQSESFFDVRRLAVPIRPDLLSAYDRIRDESVLAGRLQVPAWGANTMRTEFGFLTGLDATSLGVHRFNPYRRLARHPWPSLASRLRDQGYQTVCIHPHPVDFFARDRVYPGLGFDRFIDLDDFRQAERCGAYVADAAVTRKILEVLADARQPQLVFAITMENHGPLHLEAPDPAGWSAFYTAPPPAGFEDLSVYLRHLRNADRMIADLTTALREGYSDSLLLFFGDHVPSMPRVYQALEFNDGATDYFIWRPRQAQTGRRRTLRVEALAPWLLDAAGFGIAPAESAR